MLQVSAVNFGLLSDKEQIAIIGSFAQMLNSLSFSIQIVIHSKRLNLSSYLALLDKAEGAQANPLLMKLMTDYRQFIQSTIKENEVLDKTFYIIIPLFKLELGLTVSRASLEQKIKTTLLPRRDQVIRQLARIGLKATRLTKQKLIEVFYDIYNGQPLEQATSQTVIPSQMTVKLKSPQQIQKDSESRNVRMSEDQSVRNSDSPTIRYSGTPSSSVPTESGYSSFRSTSVPIATQQSRTHPFVVEELEE